MRFSAYEGGCTRISAQNKSDERLLKEIAKHIPEEQRGTGCNQWYFDGNSLQVTARSNPPEYALRSGIPESA